MRSGGRRRSTPARSRRRGTGFCQSDERGRGGKVVRQHDGRFPPFDRQMGEHAGCGPGAGGDQRRQEVGEEELASASPMSGGAGGKSCVSTTADSPRLIAKWENTQDAVRGPEEINAGKK